MVKDSEKNLESEKAQESGRAQYCTLLLFSLPPDPMQISKEFHCCGLYECDLPSSYPWITFPVSRLVHT